MALSGVNTVEDHHSNAKSPTIFCSFCVCKAAMGHGRLLGNLMTQKKGSEVKTFIDVEGFFIGHLGSKTYLPKRYGTLISIISIYEYLGRTALV